MILYIKAEEVIPGDQVLCPNSGCWGTVGQVEKTEQITIMAFSSGPPATIGLKLPSDKLLSVNRKTIAPRHQPQERKPARQKR